MSIGNIITLVVLLIGVSVFVFMIAAFIHEAIALPANTTDWNWGIIEHNGSSGYPDNYYDKNGNPMELTDDDLEEDEELEDEKIHEEESKEWSKDGN